MTIPVDFAVARVGQAMAMAAPADVVLAVNPDLGFAALAGAMALCTAAVAATHWTDASRRLRRRLELAKLRPHRLSKHGWPGAQTC